MTYIFNTVLACWISPYPHIVKQPYVFTNIDNLKLESLISYWNKNPNSWDCIHYPCIKEHFILCETLEDLKKIGD